MTSADIKALLSAHNITPNKALGQNFLADEAVAAAIAHAAGASAMPVLEIGPGLGALTEALLASAPHVVAVEIDAAMVRILNERFGGRENFTLRHEDFLRTDLDAIAPLQGAKCAVAANLPYYITTPICKKLVTSRLPIDRMVLMLQKEAAQRFTAQPGSKQYGPLAVLAQLYYDVSTLMQLSPASYYPQPEVDSTVLCLARKWDMPHLPGLPGVLNAAFALRRKNLLNNLRNAGLAKEEAEALLERAGLSPTARAEALPPEAFVRLAQCWRP